MNLRPWIAALSALALAACGGPSGGNALDDAGTADAGNSDAGVADAGTVQRGPISLPFAFDPEGLWWDAPSATLYIADQESNQILTWTDAKGFQVYAALPGGAQDGEDLGQLVRTAQGNLLVTIFGFGTNGAIDLVYPDGGATAIAGLDPTFRRLGLTLDSNGNLYEGYFVKNGSGGSPVGTVAQVTLSDADGGWSGTETSLVTGLGKPVGVLAENGYLYITDQATNDFIVAGISSLPTSSAPVVASGLAVDLISAGPNGTFFTGSSTGALNQLTATGTETPFASGYANPRGSAYDAANQRVFFGNHVQTGGTNQLVIVPVP